ncbi:MAG: heme-binding protein [Alphaproteobacteria bacterium]|nr:heme-binding protein [Alphaproteobacteria bacterium]
MMKQILVIIIMLSSTPAWAEYEQPSYKVILEQDKFSIRDYSEVIVVETEVVASRRDATSEAFRKLFRYISGNNEANLEISMTSPVAQTLTNQDGEIGENWAVRFFLPRSLSEENTPQPSETGVAVVKLKAQKYGSVSFKGTQNDKKVSENLAKLEAFIAENDYEVSGPPVYAFYDPPFIPWFLRDNEILLPVIANQINSENLGGYKTE